MARFAVTLWNASLNYTYMEGYRINTSVNVGQLKKLCDIRWVSKRILHIIL